MIDGEEMIGTDGKRDRMSGTIGIDGTEDRPGENGAVSGETEAVHHIGASEIGESLEKLRKTPLKLVISETIEDATFKMTAAMTIVVLVVTNRGATIVEVAVATIAAISADESTTTVAETPILATMIAPNRTLTTDDMDATTADETSTRPGDELAAIK